MSYLRDLRTGNECFLIGTAHISKKSAEEVREVIRRVKPDTVMLELCEGRAKVLRKAAAEALRGDGEGGGGGGIPSIVKTVLSALG